MGCLVLRGLSFLAGDIVGEEDEAVCVEDDESDFSRLRFMFMTSDLIPTQ